MPDARPLTVTFRRGPFYGDFKDREPKWHLARDVPESKWGTFVAHCGYTRSNILGDLRISRSKTPKKVSETCAKCVKALGKYTAPAAPSPALTARELRKVTQDVGARVEWLGKVGEVVGHYDDDSVFLQLDGHHGTTQVYVSDLRLLRE